MSDANYKIKKGTYIGIGVFLVLAAILLLITGLTIDSNFEKVLIILSIILFVLVIPYYFLAAYLINGLKDRFKELVIGDAFTSRNFIYNSRQKFLKENTKYIISRNEFEDLNYYKANSDFLFKANNLVVGSIRDVQFRSMDYKYYTEQFNLKKCGRVYSLNLKSDSSFKLVITNNDYTSLKKIDLSFNDYNVYTNNFDLANKYIISEKLEVALEKIKNYGEIFIEINNSSLYLIIDGIKESFDIVNRNYNEITEDVEREIFILNELIYSFKFEAPKPKIKKLKIK